MANPQMKRTVETVIQIQINEREIFYFIIAKICGIKIRTYYQAIFKNVFSSRSWWNNLGFILDYYRDSKTVVYIPLSVSLFL